MLYGARAYVHTPTFVEQSVCSRINSGLGKQNRQWQIYELRMAIPRGKMAKLWTRPVALHLTLPIHT